MFTAVIFDMDGVLIDSHPLHVRNWRQLLAEAGRKASDEDLQVLFEGARRSEILHRFLGELAERESEYLCRRKEQLFRAGEVELRIVAGLDAVLNTLEKARIPKAVVTSGSQSRSERLLKRFQLFHRFSVVITGDNVPNGKYDPEIFCLALNRLKVLPRQCLLVEDSSVAIRSARMLGMPAIGIAPSERAAQLLSAGAAFVAPDFTNVKLTELWEQINEQETRAGCKSRNQVPTRGACET